MYPNKRHKKNVKSKSSDNEISYKLEDFEIPKDIDTHFHLFGKSVWESKYIAVCPICDGGVDENGLCACGTGFD